MKRTMSSRALGAGLALAAALTLGACGNDDPDDKPSGDSSKTTTQTEDTQSDNDQGDDDQSSQSTSGDEPVDVAKAALIAYTSGDAATACALQTDAYTEREIAKAVKDGFLEDGATCADLVEAASAVSKKYGIDPAAAKYEEVSNDGRTATVRVAYPAPITDDGRPLILVNDGNGWLLDGEEG